MKYQGIRVFFLLTALAVSLLANAGCRGAGPAAGVAEKKIAEELARKALETGVDVVKDQVEKKMEELGKTPFPDKKKAPWESSTLQDGSKDFRSNRNIYRELEREKEQAELREYLRVMDELYKPLKEKRARSYSMRPRVKRGKK